MIFDLDDLDDEPCDDQDGPRLTCYCPACGAYLLCLGERDLTCEMCGVEFELIPKETQ